MIKFATIGTSKITKQFLEVAALCPEFKLWAVYSRDFEKAMEFGKVYGAEKYYDSLDVLANDEEVDAVYIASPNSLHYEQAKLMIQGKKHVLCEKPMGSNQYEVGRLIELAKSNHVILLEAMRSTFDPGMEAIKNNIYKLGTVRHVSFQFCQFSLRYLSFLKGEDLSVFSSELSGGALMDLGVYCVHPLVELFGKPNEVFAAPILLKNGIDGAGNNTC